MAAATALSPAEEKAGEVLRLRREIGRMQRRRSEESILPVSPALTALLPGGGLATGAVYQVAPAPSLLFSLMSAVSARGSWCAAVGMPSLGVEAAAAAGIDLSRFILVPSPDARWMSVLSALTEVVPLIAIHPPAPPHTAQAARLAARLRDRGSTVLSTSSWPQSEGRIEVSDPHWDGIGQGWGLLTERTVTITAHTRTTPRPLSVQVQMPDGQGTVQSATTPLIQLNRAVA